MLISTNKKKLLCIFTIVISFTIMIYIFLLKTYYRELLQKEVCFLLALTISLTFILSYDLLLTQKEMSQITKRLEYKILIVAYSAMLYFTLFYRDIYDNLTISNYKYILKWFKLIFDNDIVFINILGNIIIFIPLGIILSFKNKKIIHKLLFLVIIIIGLELLQYLSRRGILDLIDVGLNIIGGVIGLSINNGGSNEGRKREKRTNTWGRTRGKENN